MTEPQSPNDPTGVFTPGEARREGLKKSKWVAAGVAVGAAAFLTGVIAGVNGADESSVDGQQISSGVPGGFQPAPQYDDARSESGDEDDDDRYESDDDYGSARPFDPRSGSASSGSSTQQAPSGSSTQSGPTFGPQSRSGGS